jgi:broad specificity phosphatase PhoE
MPATLLYLVRHAETVWNAERRIQGSLDAPLTDRGIRQVWALVEAMRGIRLAAVYSSPLQRALATAQPIAEAHGLPVRVVEGLREIDQGEWESRLLDEIRETDGARLQAWWDAPETVRMPGGETLVEVQRRAMRALLEIVGHHPGETVAAVTHGGVGKCLLLALLAAPLSSYWRIRQHNACMNIVEFDGDRPRLIALNETSHLREETTHPLA